MTYLAPLLRAVEADLRAQIAADIEAQRVDISAGSDFWSGGGDLSTARVVNATLERSAAIARGTE